ncbi:MAG: hypothetical protein ACRELV_13080 [Longimicrobiales bacterium]
MRLPLATLMAAALLAGCGGAEPAEETEPLTQEQRDSAIAESGLPGAGGVRGALDAVEASEDRAEAHDTMR